MAETNKSTEMVERPRDWDKATTAAYLLSLDFTVEAAAKGAGLGERTLQRYKQSPWWPDAIRDASQKFMSEIEALTKAAIIRALKDPEQAPQMARWVAERLIPELAPPKIKLEARALESDEDDWVGVDRRVLRARAEERIKVIEGTH